MRHFVYKTINKINNKCYIGVKSCKCDFFETNYYGSGIALLRAIKKYGKENFVREVLGEFLTSQEAYEYEAILVNNKFINNNNNYNLKIGGIGGCPITRLVKCKSIDINGNIKYYNSIKEASLITGISANYISRCLNPKRKYYKTTGGLRWEKCNLSHINVQKPSIKRNNNKPCYSTNLDNGVVIKYNSISEASQISGISEQHIRENIKNIRGPVHRLAWSLEGKEVTNARH
jgi:hypothetical protein